ncbi:hypothetical protein TVAG_083210 [Trichomonas vaginalis G3]|uniref:Uncharacterized protein n=1 Tax=Trichomonas vaginalis (strain ATCC PRA-98 / G3) TaxID=412133 RepID=A2DM48_TRIV3|nr:hypothetical protein TVAGG3_0984150 [Trichomonas vaginalis G3]EAY18468.1 hypothetical protein TVAG_083210 [Trichomonas vaginalis G3]KAI5489543.1 hypothetical protein TVAGG3_0984150 [Trichomonas vaginalis G3]|eukprot:XP_001579454.1 hypothetical protein [Trichomonas vaginalis G3]
MAEKRHFMAIGGGPIGHPAIPNFQLPNRQLLNAPIRQISGSFVLPHPAIKKEPPKKFPDIFTTCPELRNFKMPIVNFQKQLSPSIPLLEPSEPFPESPVQGSFDPNANCINPYVHFFNLSLSFFIFFEENLKDSKQVF